MTTSTPGMASGQSRASRYSVVMPMMLVPQLVLPNTSCPLVREVGATTCTSGMSSAMACASSSVRRWRVCAPRRTPACDTPPGSTSMMFDPSPFICSCTRCVAPLPTATMVMTAATPMMMPSIVSMERRVLAASACSALRNAASEFMRPPCRVRAEQRLPQSDHRETPACAAPTGRCRSRGSRSLPSCPAHSAPSTAA